MAEPTSTKEDVKHRIENAYISISWKTLIAVKQNIIETINKYLQVNGKHFEHLIK